MKELQQATPLAELVSSNGYHRVNVFRADKKYFYTTQTKSDVCAACEDYSFSPPLLYSLHTDDWEEELRNIINTHDMSIQLTLFT